MNNLSEIFILARNGDTSFEWVVPVIVLVIWIIGGIGKAIAAAREERKRRESIKSKVSKSEKKMRYKPIQDTSSQQQSERTEPKDFSFERDRETTSFEYEEPKRKRTGTMASLKKAMKDAMEEAHAQKAKRKAIKAKIRKPKKVKRQTVRKASETADQRFVESIVEVDDPLHGSVLKELLERENIRKAVIYSEILGKPLAMREH